MSCATPYYNIKDAATDDTKQTVQTIIWGDISLSYFHDDELMVQLCLVWLNGLQLTNPKEAKTKFDTYKYT